MWILFKTLTSLALRVAGETMSDSQAEWCQADDKGGS